MSTTTWSTSGSASRGLSWLRNPKVKYMWDCLPSTLQRKLHKVKWVQACTADHPEDGTMKALQAWFFQWRYVCTRSESNHVQFSAEMRPTRRPRPANWPHPEAEGAAPGQRERSTSPAGHPCTQPCAPRDLVLRMGRSRICQSGHLHHRGILGVQQGEEHLQQHPSQL